MPDVAAPSADRIWDTQCVSTSEAFDFYHGAVCSAFSHLEPMVEKETRSSFRARVESRGIDAGFINRVNSTSHLVVRTKADIARGNVDWYYFNLYLSDGCEITQNGRTVRARSGDMAFFAGASPFMLEHRHTSSMSVVSFMAPGGILRERWGDRLPDRPVLVAAHDLLGPLVRETARLLVDRPEDLSSEARHRLFESMFEFAVLSETDQPLRAHVSRSFKLFSAIRAYIAEHSGDQGLNIARIAHVHGVSARYVHKLFSNFAQGQTVADQITATRLDRATTLLRTAPGTRITDVALDAGFSDLSQFYRTFRARHGCAPGVYRNGSV